MSVDCSRPARTTGGASDSDTVTLRGGLAVKGCGGVEALSETQARARLAATAIGIGGFMASAPSLEIGYTASPWAKREMPSVSPYFSISLDRRTRSFGLVENVA